MYNGGKLRATRSHAALRWFKPSMYVRTTLWLCLLIGLVYSNLARVSYEQFRVAVTPRAAALSEVKPSRAGAGTTSANQPSSAPKSLPATGAAKSQIEIPQSCTGSPYHEPGAIALSRAQPGLTSIVDSPTYYQVYGRTIDGLRDAVEACPLRHAIEPYHAATTYQLNWSYSLSQAGDVCQLTDIRIGIHVNQYLPLFIATSSTPENTVATWNQYATQLRAHEDGHVVIDTDYAQRLTTALQDLTSDCGAIALQARTITDTYVSLLDGANALYDSQTNHGLTQGAVL